MQLRTTGLARLDAAIRGFDTAREQALAPTAAIVAAATALDAADAACAVGVRGDALEARAPARAALPKAKTALAVLPLRLKAYGSSLSELAAAAKAATSLNEEQRSAVQAVVTGGQAEAAAADAFRVAGKTALPAYLELDRAQSTWLDRSLAGWYRNSTEAANAYDVLIGDQRAALQQARTLLRRVDAARRPISERERAALAAADAALAPLRE